MVKEKGSKTKFQSVRGMRDILPENQKYWHLIRQKILSLMTSYRYGRLDTPILEETKLFTHGLGKQTDIVEKEMFSFVDQGGENLTLRPEATASVVRSYVEHGMLSQPQPVKIYYEGSMFRRERPQSGRLRQFYQFGCEVIGSDKATIDSQLITIGYHLLKELKIDTVVQINSIGCPACRSGYIKSLVGYYKNKKASICDNCRSRLTKNPLRLLDCKEEKCQEFKKEAPQILDWLCEDCRAHFEEVLEYLDGVEIPYNLNSSLVRGLDYYNRTVFEFYDNTEEEGRQNALGGGGRYDYLTKQLGAREDRPAAGFALGLERIITRMRDLNVLEVPEPKYDIFLTQLGKAARCKAMALFDKLRLAGIAVAESFDKDGLKPQLEMANKLGVQYAIIIGQKEVIDGTVLFRNMEGGVQETVDYNKVVSELVKRLKI